MKINVMEELEQAHEKYLEQKKSILLDLAMLNNALIDMTSLHEEMTEEHLTNFYEIIKNTMNFIDKGEI